MILMLGISSVVQSSDTPFVQKDTLLIMPARAQSSSWKAENNALVHDVDENGVYQSFTKSNSAFLPGDAYIEIVPEPSGDSVDTVNSNETVVPDSTDLPTEVPQSDVQENTSDSLDTAEPAEQEEESSPAETPEPASESSGEPTVLHSEMYYFTALANKPLLLAHESLIEHVDESIQHIESHVNEQEQVLEVLEVSQTSENAESGGEDPSLPVVPDQQVDSTKSLLEDGGAETTSEPVFVSPEGPEVLFSGFGIPELASGQFIRNVQLRVSLGARMEESASENGFVEVEYRQDGEWASAGSILIEGENSNAFNGGYFLFALPKLFDAHKLDNLEVRIKYVGDTKALEYVYVDSLWVELDTELFDRALLEERVDASAMNHLKLPEIYEILSSDLDFTRNELPKFSLKYISQRNFAVRFVRDLLGKRLADVTEVEVIQEYVGPVNIRPRVDVTAEGLFTIQFSENDIKKLKPGEYIIDVTVDEGGKTFNDSFSFQWGLLAINPNQTEYQVGDTVHISLGALSQNGNTLCEANLALYIIDPEEFISEVPVQRSGLCNGNNVIDRPDYLAELPVEKPGTYEMYVERLDEAGEVLSHTYDTFLVKEKHPLYISREGPTRIYPVASYPMKITVFAESGFSGTLTESVPANFGILETDARVERSGTSQTLSWDVSLASGESATFTYTFDAPDISPLLYSVGPAELLNEDHTVVITETASSSEEELLAEVIEERLDTTVTVDGSDQVEAPAVVEEEQVNEPQEEASVDQATNEAESVEVISTTPAEVVREEVIAEESFVGSIVDTVTDSVSNFVDTLFGSSDSEPTQTDDDAVSQVDTGNIHVIEDSLGSGEVFTSESASTTSLTTPQTTSTFKEHRRWQIASDATGSMIVFWTSSTTIPAGWTCISCTGTSTFSGRLPVGGATYGTTGGTTTHSHTADGAVSQTNAAATSENRAGTAASITTHSHTYTPIIQSTSTLPAYRMLRIIQNNNAGDPGTIPAGAVLMFDTTLPAGWAQYTALDDRYPLGGNNIVSSSSNSHAHGVSGITSSSTGTTYDNRATGGQASPLPASVNHGHVVSATTTPVNFEPPYIQVIFATSSVATTTPTSSISMWSDTPPAGWLNRSATTTDPFYGKYIKGGSTYGTTGGADTHTHATLIASSSSSTVSTTGRNTAPLGAVGSTHTHDITVSNFSTASNSPPYVTVIFAKFYGYIPIFTQSGFFWYTNSTSSTPTDPWPSGGVDVTENQVIDSDFTPVKNGDVLRLRMQVNVSNSTSTSDVFRLQYGSTTSGLCTDVTNWNNVGNLASSTEWIGYNNTVLSDGATLAASVITGTDVLETYEEENPTATLPNQIGLNQEAEWDFVIKHNGARADTTFCFRMVKSDGTTFFAYTQYPMLVTNAPPSSPTLSLPFDNEKVGTTTPRFKFTAVDPESNDVTYQIQIDTDSAFGSPDFDQDSANNGDQFENITTPADKDPYTNGETIQYTLPSALTNGVTYYWRVRAEDPTGSDTLGSWSRTYSFTVDTSVTVSTWFQTTEAQFDTDTLAGTDALGTNLVQLITGSTTGTTTSSAIDFTDGTTGNAWGTFSWTDNETVGDIKYRIQYYDNATESWITVPDADLSGNSAGFDTSPISLLTLDVNTYTVIRIVGVFTNSGGTPTLSDWTVAWGYRIDTPTINSPFDNEKVSTTTPTFEFTTTDPQGDALEYEFQWSTTSTFTSSSTRNSSTSASFRNITDTLDTNPFTSGNTIQFTIPTTTALTNGQTYWWRVRARDPLGTNQYSFYTDERSFTVDTSVTVSTWFQTTGEQFQTDTLSNARIVSTTSVSVSTTSSESLVAYAEGSTSTPRYRIWDGSAWGTESSALDVGAAISWVVTQSSPIENEYILATMGTDGDVNAQVYSNGSWGHLQEVTATIANTSMRGFDVAYEQTSGDVMVVSCDGDASPSYYIWNGSSWTLGSTTIGLINGNTCGWVKLISDPVSDEIIAVTRDTSGLFYEVRVWSGTAWGNSFRFGTMNQPAHEGIAAAYEDSGNQAVVAVSNGTNASFMWSAWNGTSWSATTTATVALGDDFEAGMIASDDGSDNMMLCYVDEDRDIGVVRWTGSAWTGQLEHYVNWGATTAVYDDRPIDCAYETTAGRDGNLMAVYATTTGVAYQVWNGATWSTAAKASTLGLGPRVQARRTDNGLIQVLSYATSSDRYDYSYWNGTTWSTLTTIESDGAAGATPFKEPFMITPKNPVTVASVVGDTLDFEEGAGPYWQQMSWTDTESGGSSILYQVEYYDTTTQSWELIPNSLIPGNSTGTGTSPINLANVLPVSTYRYIRPVANMTCNLGTCPVLSDWTITWAAGITISGTAQAFNESTNVTSGSVAVALNGVLQTGKTGTISGGTWSIANVNASPGDLVTVFVNGANDANEAVALARYDGVGDMTGLRLYEQHVTLGSNDATTTPFTNASFALYDATNDEDLFFDGSGTSLDLCVDATGCGSSELYIMASSTYTPGGFVDAVSIENNGTINMGGNTIYVGGSWDNNATTSSATSTVVFTATSSTSTIDQTGAISPSFYNLTFGTTTGSAAWTLIAALDVNNNLTVTRGTVARGTTSITIGGSLSNGANGIWTGMGTTTFDGSGTSNWSDSNTTLQNVGRVLVDGTTKTIQLSGNVRAERIVIGSDDTLDASTSNYDITVLGDWVNNSTFVARSGEVIFAATTTNREITAGSDAFYDLTFSGAGGSWSFVESTLTVNNDFRVSTGTVTMPTATTTITGSFSSVGGTFAHNNSIVLFNSSAAETIAASTTAFTNAFYNLRFTGSGSWSFSDVNATTTNDLTITQGTVTAPSGTLTVGGSYEQSGGTFTHNSGTVKFTSASAETIDVNASSFNNLAFTGSGSWSFIDSSVTVTGSITTSGGTTTFPSGTLTLGGSITNTATITHNSGTVLFNATSGTSTISLGNSSLYNATFNSASGRWNITNAATTTNNLTLTSVSAFLVNSGVTVSVGGTFTNNANGASTTWTGSTLSLEAGSYTMNSTSSSVDVYGTLRVKTGARIAMWNSSATSYDVQTNASLYSQDHAGVDGELYIFGDYVRTSGSEYWSYATDFDGTAIATSSRRQAKVYFESGATVAISNSLFEVAGTSSATTTVQKQSSGTYTVSVTGGTTTALYYSFVDLGATGVSLAGTNKVTSLARGFVSPGTAGGTGFTISSTTIDANPGLQIYNVNFSTTSSIVANNVKQIDGTPTSYWWFRESTGSIDGEGNDLDTGDPGSIRWDDSSLVISISGVVYSDDGVTTMGTPTCDGSTQNIRVRVENGSTYTGSCAAGNGSFTVSGVTVVGDPVVAIYLDTNGGAQGSVITQTPTANITNLNIYQNRVITRHEDVTPLTIADMAVFDSEDDSDLRFDAATGTTNTLAVFAGNELHIASSTTFVPGGDITIYGNASSSAQDGSLHIDDLATFTGAGTSTYSIAGSFTLDQGATFTAASTTVLLNATTTGKTITTPSTQEITFNTLTFNGAGGGWNINGDIRSTASITVAVGTVSGTADITVVNGSLSGNGTLSMGSGTTTVEKSNTLGGTTAWTFGNLVLGSGSVAGTTTPGGATTTILGKLVISTAHYLDGGNTVWNLAGTGNVFTENGTFLEDTTTVRYSGTGATNVISTTYYNLDLKAQGSSPTYTGTGIGINVLNNLTIGGASATTFDLNTNDPILDVNGNLTIDSTGTFGGSGSASTTIGGSWDNNGTFNGNSGTITFDGAGTVSIAAGTSSFSNLTINGSGAYTISEHATATSAFRLANAGSFTLSSGQVLAVGGTFTNAVGGAATTWTGSTLSLYSGTNYSINTKTVSDSYATLNVATNTDIRMWNSSASTYSVDSTGSLYSQDHAAVDGNLYIYGNYPGAGSTDFWSYATDFDGTSLGGSQRKVDVFFASGASAEIVSGGLAVVGSASASTTLQNQGSGTYGLRIGGTASTTWSYYEVTDTNSSGLVFSGTPNVVTLSYGSFEVGQNSGTAITVGGTAITQNPAKTFTNNTFATSTGVSPAFNVTATGTSVSSWRFTNHTGSIDGESYDVDPDGDPGYITWDDSAALITIAGNVYSGEGSGVSGACDGSTSNVHIRVAGLTSYTTTCNASTGAYSRGGVSYSPGDSLIVYIDGEPEKAATVSEDPVSNISNMDLYENRVIVRHESTDPLSIADMAIWDSSDDADIPFTAIDAGSDTLTLPADRKLIVWNSKEFEPAGNVTVSGGGSGAAYDGTLELYTNAIFDATGSETHTIGGSLIMGSGATMDDETSTFIFTTSGSARTVDSNDETFYNLTFNGSGSWTVTNTTLTVGNDLTISQGAVTLPAATTTVTGSLSASGGTFASNGGTVLFNSAAAETINPGSSSFRNLTFNGTGSFVMQGTNATTTGNFRILDGSVTGATGTLTIAGNFINADTYTHGSGVLRFTSSSTALVTAGGSDLFTTRFDGAGAFTFTNANVALLGSLAINAGSVTLATGTMSIGGSFLNTGGSFSHSSGTILFNSSDTGEIINPGSSPFYAVSFASASGGWTISAHATATSNFTLTTASSFAVASATRLYVGGVFTNLVGGAATTWTGSTLVINTGSGYTINTKTAGGDTYNNVVIGSSTALRAWDSAGSITVSDSGSSLYSQDHAGTAGALYIYGNYTRTTGTDYWSYATDFDGTALGGSSRQVFVSLASGATTTLTGGSLEIVGSAGFETAVSNQGSGTYAVSILGGTFNAQYYSFANMNATGLNLQGTTSVTSLTEGDFTLAVNGGALITLSSTTLNYNAGLVITGASFATTTAITGYNVSLTGTTPSAWTFTSHTGNLDGEVYDNDGGDACGSINWDDSSCLQSSQSAYRFRADDGGEGVPNSEWYDQNWTKRKRVKIENPDAVSYTNAVIEVPVTFDSDMQPDFDDLRFTDSDGTTLLSHFRETYTASTDATVWVEVPLLATSTATEVYMYYGNGAASDTSATTTFAMMDNFEDGNISEYSGDTPEYTVSGSSAYERTYRLNASDPANGKTDFGGMYNNNYVVSQGQTIRALRYIDAAETGDESCLTFGTQSQTVNYGVCIELFGVDRMSLVENVLHRDTSGTVIASTTVTYTTGWHEIEIEWRTNNSMYVSLYKDNVLVATTTGSDSSHTTGGIGFTLWTDHGGWDIVSSRPLLTTEPTVSLGAEQVSGGASWVAAVNAAAPGVDIDEKIRVRFLVENSGSAVVNQNYELEFASKGASPSCEAVNYNSYVEVPDAATCGSSEICMAPSTNITNLASTTDLLGGDGTFTFGQIVEDPSNNTGNITVNNGEFTELEYVISPTSNAVDSAYCLRVTNEGTELDAYTKVAEMGLVFAPDISSFILNDIQDIVLTPGTTTRLTATGTVTDSNGYTDLVAATTTIFRSGVGESCTADNNNCYIVGSSSCNFTNCSGNSCDVVCSADVYYYADPTDLGSTYDGETWRALLRVQDNGGSVATTTAPSVDLLTTQALSVINTINYGSLSVEADTGSYNASTTIQNIGNSPIDVALEGTDLTSGASVIPVTQQRYATSTFTYSSCTVCNALSTTSATYQLNLSKPTTTVSTPSDDIFWGIAIPFGVAGTAHQGVNTFYATTDL